MKNLINISNPTTGNQVVTIQELKDIISNRRKVALNPLNKKANRPNVMATNKQSLQVAAHYKSFEIERFGYNKALEVFNAGGCQVANRLD